MAISTTILIDGNLSNGGFVTPTGSSASPLSTTAGDDLVILTSIGGTGLVADWFVSTVAGGDTVNINGSLLSSNITLGEGADVFSINRFGLGGSINTSLIAGNAGNDTLNLLVGGNGAANSTFRGGAGDDLINLDGNFTDVFVVGGQGNDQIEFQSPGLFTGSTAQGGQGNDIILDNGFAVDFSGSTLRGGAGNDTIDVSNSFVLEPDGLFIAGGVGDDDLYGTLTGQNTIGGGQGDDFIQAFDGDDLLRGGDGNDIIIAGFGNDTVEGDNDDQVGDDVIFGINGSNKIFARGGNDFVAGGLADDSIEGGEGNDTLLGGAGNDTIKGGAGNDIIFGDDISLQTGVGFAAFNVVVPPVPPAVLPTLTDIAAQVIDQYTANALVANALAVGTPVIPAVAGTPPVVPNYNGEATFVNFTNFLGGGDGNDFIFGGQSFDVIEGGSGNDTITGGAGSDVMSGGGASGNDVFVQGIGASFAADAIVGGSLAVPNSGSNYLFTWTGNAPDIITDFVANSGTNIVDRIAFESEFAPNDWAGALSPVANQISTQTPSLFPFTFVDATNTPNVSTAIDDIVVLSGIWDGNNQTFAASADGPDALAFVAVGNLAGGTGLFDGAAATGSQAVLLLGAGTQSFQAGNFAFA